jgi:hypothetical protein
MTQAALKNDTVEPLTADDIKQQAEFNMLEATISDEAYQSVGLEPANDAQFEEPETSEILKPVLSMAFGILAPNWNVTETETDQLAESYGLLVDKYFPDGVGNYGLEINAFMITGAVLLPRLKTPRKVEEKQEDGEES